MTPFFPPEPDGFRVRYWRADDSGGEAGISDFRDRAAAVAHASTTALLRGVNRVEIVALWLREERG